MSDILFCSTDLTGVPEVLWDHAKSFQFSSLLRLEPDLFGLQSWYEHHDKIDWDKYKLIWIHLNPRVMNPAWHSFTKKIRNKAPNAIIGVKYEWFEMFYYRDMPYLVKRAFESGDFIHVNTQIAYDLLQDKLNIKIIHKKIGQPRVDEMIPPEQIPWEEREGIFFLEHSVPIIPNIRKFEYCNELGLPVKIISTMPVIEAKGRLEQMANTYGVEAEVYNRLPWEDYMSLMGSCKVAIIFEYYGICRMAYEAAFMGVPVVGTKNSDYRTVLYPELTVPEKYLPSTTELIRQVYHTEQKPLNKFALDTAREYWSQEACKARLLELFEEVGYEFKG